MKSGKIVCEVPARAMAGSPPAITSATRPCLPPGFARQAPDASRFTPVLTLVLWMGCSLVGALGFVMPYVRPQAAKPQPPPLQVEMLNIELSNDPLPDVEPPPAKALAVPPPPDAVVQPQLPQAVAVAMPSPAIAFALPVDGPVRVVAAAQASYSQPATPGAEVTSAGPAIQPLVFGRGAGKQPAPEYPLAAERAGQEGSVNVRFVVGENGRVTTAETVAASPWPLLNESALRTIRNRWRFPAGNLRAYEVAIRFVLPK